MENFYLTEENMTAQIQEQNMMVLGYLINGLLLV